MSEIIRTEAASSQRAVPQVRDMQFAMQLSLAVGVLMLFGKVTAYFMTHSAAILSDAAESVVHVAAVAFAAFSLRLSGKPAAPQFLYGYERITFFSAGFEGAMIILAAIAILAAAIQKWITGLQLENLGNRSATGDCGRYLECRARVLSVASGTALSVADSGGRQ